MVEPAQTLEEAIAYYASGGTNLKTFYTKDEAQKAYSVLIVDSPVYHYPAAIVVMARIEGEWVLVEADNTDRPLVDRLVAAGIPRERIILTYAGETIPQPHDNNA